MFPESKIYGAWYHTTPQEKPNLWIVYFLSEKEDRIERVRIFDSKEACTKGIDHMMSLYDKYKMDRARICIREAVAAEGSYLFATVATYTTVCVGGSDLRYENCIDLKALVVMTNTHIPDGVLTDISKHIAVNSSVVVNLEQIETEESVQNGIEEAEAFIW